MKNFFKDFVFENKTQIFIFSCLRVLSFVQVLFWPYAFSKIINLISENPKNWEGAFFWAVLLIFNSIAEDFVRLRAKFGLEKIGAKLKISLATFFSEKTRIREDKKTGEAVQAIKKASEDIESLVSFYKNDLLGLPVNFIVIPFMLFKANVDYLILLIAYGLLYLLIDCLAVKFYYRKLLKSFKAAEIFWGTTYRKTPEIWREREDSETFAQRVDLEGEELYKSLISTDNADSWRWAFLQSFSSAAIGLSILFVLYTIVNNSAPVGDLVLVSGYFREIQGTLNIVTSTITHILQTRISLKRLGKAVEVK